MTYASGKEMRGVWLALLLTCLVGFSACGGGNTSDVEQLPIAITLSPSTTTLSVGQSATVSAAVYDQTKQGATWTITPIDFGTLTDQTPSSVTYNAPQRFSVATTVTITATSITNPNIASSVKITVSPVILSLFPTASQTLNQGEQLILGSNIAGDLSGAGVTWSLAPASGAGTLDSVQPFGVNYIAPATVASPTTVTVTATLVANPSVQATRNITVFPDGAGFNVASVNVDGGPTSGKGHANGAFTSVTICNPGTTLICQTVDGILVDTGSYGLRILQSQIPLLKLPALVDGNKNTLESCVSYPDASFLWGPVARADIWIAQEQASFALVQVISNGTDLVPDSCANGGITNLNSPQLLGANGILGIGPEPTDCTVAGSNLCDGSVQPVPPNLYYQCPPTGCLATDGPVVVPAPQQIINPIVLFSDDYTGSILRLPAVTGNGAINGSLVFGIGTQSNNDLGSATIFPLDSNDNFTTVFGGQTLTRSFLDSGAPALFFPSNLPACSENPAFFCPLSVTHLTAENDGAGQGQNTIAFDVANADQLFASHPGEPVFVDLAGSNGTFNTCSGGTGACTFDWGLPFFYGRNVYTAINGKTPPGTNVAGPWWAY